MNRALTIIFAILIIIAAFLGYKIYEQRSASTTSVDTTTTQNPAPVSNTTNTNNAASTQNKSLLVTPAANATDAEKNAYAQNLFKVAVKTTSIDISRCEAKPTASSVKDASDVTFVNKDSVDHTIVFNKDLIFKIPASGQKIIKASFGKGPGIYGFGCDNSNKAVGMVVVNP